MDTNLMNYSYLVIVFLFLALGFTYLSLFKIRNKVKFQNTKLAELNAEIAVLNEKNDNLVKTHDDKISTFETLLDDKQLSMEKILKDKNQQIEDLKSERTSVLDDVKDFLSENFKSTTHEAFDSANEKLFSQFETYF